MSIAIPVKAPPLNLPSHRDPYYAGAWQKSAGRHVEVTSPGTGESLGKVAEGNTADAEAAIAAAKSAFRDWRRVAPVERAKMLRAIAQVLRQNGDELAMIDAADCGNP
jgi:betaine-aldehyde dehydrogenase